MVRVLNTDFLNGQHDFILFPVFHHIQVSQVKPELKFPLTYNGQLLGYKRQYGGGTADSL